MAGIVCTVKTAFKNSIWVFWSVVFVLGFLAAWKNSLTTSADLLRNDVPFKSWHPYVWEYTSFVCIFILYFAVYRLAHKYPLFVSKWPKNFIIHVLASVLFSLLHVLWMVWLRQLIYHWMGSTYDFGDWINEWLYEYRKDVVTYFVFILLLAAYKHFTQVKQPTKNVTGKKKFQVKNKQGVFWLDQAEIITIESGGNYVYFHTNQQVIPMRGTMAEVVKSIDHADFMRIHRSYIVNLKHSKALKKNNADSSELVLLNGKSIPVSKKYRNQLLTLLEQRTN